MSHWYDLGDLWNFQQEINELESLLLQRIVMRQTTMTRRFYIGSKDMAKTYLKNGEVPGNMMLLSEAVENAKDMVENMGEEIIFVVEVVKIVRRASQPIIVEDVR